MQVADGKIPERLCDRWWHNSHVQTNITTGVKTASTLDPTEKISCCVLDVGQEMVKHFQWKIFSIFWLKYFSFT